MRYRRGDSGMGSRPGGRATLFGCLALLLLAGTSHAVYLKDWRETRVVVEVSAGAVANLGVSGEQLETQVGELLSNDPVALTVTSRSHGYLYLRLIADRVPDQQYFGVLDVRVVRPVVIVPIGRVAVAGVWEESITFSGPLKSFREDLRGALRGVFTKLTKDWRRDNQ